MLTRSGRRHNKNNRKTNLKTSILRFIHFSSQAYMYLGVFFLIVVVMLTVVDPTFFHRKTPFHYQLYIRDETELCIWLMAVITSFFLSGVIAVMTMRRATEADEKDRNLIPHFHVKSDQFLARYSIVDFRMMDVKGTFHKKQHKEIVAWAKENHALLIHEWNRLSPDGKLVIEVVDDKVNALTS